ncbi:hypothetical protein C1752_00614 [Acaryochloris thomasi RCC1774]|uniref:Calcineurin-like phosphoesterase domain-containing protein n=1 Tax=Acaryochloris thomasi RCC1774 TaxID=1764569 RepID=A0A2W1JYY2_9CYAN|nr:metallophosphoesterase [Acaryochloris thomasi]PZD74664.1 hypothetical protein C1752_00614 [Acaryochloris thomasi RCC1774]
MKSLKWFLLGPLGLLCLLVLWGLIEPHFLNVEEETAVIPNLPKAWEGQKIGQLSDFQVGLWADNPDTGHRGVKKLIEVQPAAVFISGDFIYHAKPDPAAEIEEAVSIVRPLVEAGIPTYAVLGNHDYGMSSKKAPPDTELASNLETELETAGIVVLKNESTQMRLPNSDEPLYLAAVGSLWAKQDDVSKTLEGIPANSPRVVMMHNPDTFELFPANSAPLAVAGHTHGGQMRLPASPQWSWLRFTQDDKVYADGWAKGYGKPGNNLYVNIGIGMSMVPIRIFCPPELTIFTLRSS